jgi:hypothetical protein
MAAAPPVQGSNLVLPWQQRSRRVRRAAPPSFTMQQGRPHMAAAPATPSTSATMRHRQHHLHLPCSRAARLWQQGRPPKVANPES